MSKLTVICNLTMDGVMQAPAAPDEDPRGGFEHGGWATPFSSDAMGRLLANGTKSSDAMLFGRTTYTRFAEVWPGQPDNPYTEVLNKTQKYVASTTLKEPLPWMNSTLLPGDAVESVRQLKTDRPEQNLIMLGSGVLIRSLLPAGLIDEFNLLIHPLLLGGGRRLFADDGVAADFELVDSFGTSTGVIIGTYRPVRT
jgi:dihydrofolate reductase